MQFLTLKSSTHSLSIKRWIGMRKLNADDMIMLIGFINRLQADEK